MATRTKKITAAQQEKKVRVAIVDLEQEGKRPTYANVRDKIGGGSFRDLGPIIKAILAEQDARAKAESQVPDMPEDVAELATALWEGAYRCADMVAAAERRAHAEEVTRFQQEIRDREDDVAAAEDALDEMTARAQTAEEMKSKLEQELVDLRLVIAGLEGRLFGRQEAASEEGKGRKKASSGQISHVDKPDEDDFLSYETYTKEAEGKTRRDTDEDEDCGPDEEAA